MSSTPMKKARLSWKHYYKVQFVIWMNNYFQLNHIACNLQIWWEDQAQAFNANLQFFDSLF